MLLLTSGCPGPNGGPPEVRPLPPAARTLAHPPPPDAVNGGRGAMLSVYFNAHADPDDRRLHPTLRPVPLASAASILARARGRLAESRRIRAIVKLAAAGLDRPAHRDALTTLRAPLRRVEAEIAAHPRATQAELEQHLYPLLGYTVAVEGCVRSTPTTVVHFDPSTQITTVQVTAAVRERPLDEVARIIDPQSWDECSEYFDNAYVAEQVAGVYPIDSNFDPKKHPAPPAKGSSWNAER